MPAPGHSLQQSPPQRGVTISPRRRDGQAEDDAVHIVFLALDLQRGFLLDQSRLYVQRSSASVSLAVLERSRR
jgi:hypothetical protein